MTVTDMATAMGSSRRSGPKSDDPTRERQLNSRSAGSGGIARGLAVAVLAIPLAALIVRNTTAVAFSESDPESAAEVWPSHPAVEISRGMIAIAAAARQRQAVTPEILQSVYDASRRIRSRPNRFSFGSGSAARR